MTALNESSHPGEFLLNEFDPNHEHDVITLASGQDLKGGAVLGKITSGGKFAAYDNAAMDGTEVAAGILWEDTDASAGDVDCAAVVRGPALVKKPELKWADDQDATAQAAGIVDLAAIGIVAR